MSKALFYMLNYGAGNRSRTYDLRITNALLYQLSYTGQVELILPSLSGRSIPLGCFVSRNGRSVVCLFSF